MQALFHYAFSLQYRSATGYQPYGITAGMRIYTKKFL
jgi:hypothetical protein